MQSLIQCAAPVPARNPPNFIATSRAQHDDDKKLAVMKIVPDIAGVKIFRRASWAGRSSRRRGRLEHNAIDAKVSMMTLIHNSCMHVNGFHAEQQNSRNVDRQRTDVDVN